MLSAIKPMLATLIRKPFNGQDWLFEIKWDGYRALAFINRSKVKLFSRTEHEWHHFTSVVNELKKVPGQAVLDGELVILDKEGIPHFQLMQDYQRTGEGSLCYYVFDLLYKDGVDLRKNSLIERKTILKELLDKLASPIIRYSDHILYNGVAFFDEATKLHLEGIVGKKIDSTYQSTRSKDWVKIKTILRQEFVIGGFTAPKGGRKKFGALMVGYYQKGVLTYAGLVGGGFNSISLDEIYEKLQPLIQDHSPFNTTPKMKNTTWVKPKLVCEVSFSEWTKDGIMRQPIFQGLRKDKPAKDVIAETEPTKTKEKTSKPKFLTKYTNTEKIYWPTEGITKGDLLEYYNGVSSFILPYLKNRPIVMHRYPEGITGQEFYQKDLLPPHPDYIKTLSIRQEGRIIHYLMINDVKSLLYAVNLGSIDIHPFIARRQDLEHPDYCVIDLDPQHNPFDFVIEIAQAVHQLLEEIQVNSFCKTSGGKGLHIYIPLRAKYDFEQSRQFAELIALCIHQQLPRITSLERRPSKRETKVYIDYLQNRIAQTVVAPYSVRPRPGACVSTPLLWEEVKKGLHPSQFTIKNALERFNDLGDIFKPTLGAGINMKKAIQALKNWSIHHHM